MILPRDVSLQLKALTESLKDIKINNPSPDIDIKKIFNTNPFGVEEFVKEIKELNN